MAIWNFICANWDSILIVVAIIVACIILVWKGKKSVVEKLIFKIVTDLEGKYGSGTGKLKLAAAVETLYPKLPAIIKYFVSAETLVKWIEEGLKTAKEVWASNPAIIDYVNKENATFTDIILSEIDAAKKDKEETTEETDEATGNS